jgi:type VI secretion system protein ImpF
VSARRERAEPVLRPSLLDRLMAPPSPPERAARHQLEAIGLPELRAAVGRDLEWLLNTKQGQPAPGEELPEVASSIWMYGLPDLSTLSASSADDLSVVARRLEELIRCYEPRLRPGTIKVSPRPDPDADEFRLSFRIEAVLHVEPIRSPVSFDTDIDFRSGAAAVRNEA